MASAKVGMILLGLTDAEKSAEVERYCATHTISKVYVLSPERFAPTFAPTKMVDPTTEGDGRSGLYIDWPDLIMYRFYYKLLQEIDKDTLVVVNECLRTQNRHELTYNCVRLYLAQTEHRLIFQYLPLIDTIDDFAILFDLDTKSRWKRGKIGALPLAEASICVSSVRLSMRPIDVKTDAKTKTVYDREKAKLLEEVRSDPGKDPHLIPRNLLLVGGKAKLGHVDPTRHYVGRNDRFKLPNLATYREPSYPSTPYTVFEPPHNFIDFADFLALSRQTELDVLVSDLKVDQWYWQRYQDWIGRLRGAYKFLGGGA